MDLQEALQPEVEKSSWFVVGDSHAKIFQNIATKGLLNRQCTVVSVGGATAVGLRHPNSATNALNIFKGALLPAKTNTIPVIQLGEVDCGFVIWYRTSKYGETIQSQVKESIAAYFEFVDELRANGYSKVVITGATLPTIYDGQDWGDVAKARGQVSATLKERTDLTLRYNKFLLRGARERRIPYIDINSHVLDPETGVIADEFRHANKTNHHLRPHKIGPLWAAALNRLARKRQL